MSAATYVVGDVRDVLAAIPDGSVDLVLTSPPFLALRSYLPADHPDKHREIGSEPTPAAFIDTLLALTAEWRRVLAPHGSICIELGDTYSGSGGAGGDYSPGGLRDGQERFDGSASKAFGVGAAPRPARNRTRSPGPDWPMDKSLCLIPELYRVALAYGRNPLTGTESPAGAWRVRNNVRWCRPNPPVGALGDKFRPGTSDMVIACTARDRYFDLDAVRVPHIVPEAATPEGARAVSTLNRSAPGEHRSSEHRMMSNAAGAPPLDWWQISTEPYAGSHYATWPSKLLERPIKAMCPQRVCTVCGEPSRRIVDSDRPAVSEREGKIHVGRIGGSRLGIGGAEMQTTYTTLGWTDCGHGSYRCRTCHVLVPLDHALRQSRTTQASESGVGETGLLVESVEGASRQAVDSGDVRAVRGGVPGAAGSEVLHPELFGETGARRGTGEHDPATDAEPRTSRDGERVRAALGADGDSRTPTERADDGASNSDARPSWPGVGTVGDRAPSKWDQGRQPDRESGSGDQGPPCGDGGLPALPADVPGQLGGYVCPCGSTEIEYVADQWRNGLVLDPFGGSGTTGLVATGHGRDCLLIDIDARNADLARERIGGLFLTTYTLDEWKAA